MAHRDVSYIASGCWVPGTLGFTSCGALRLISSCFHPILLLLLFSHDQVRGHRTGSNHSGAEEIPQGKTQTTQGGTRIYIPQLTQFMPPPETHKCEIGSQSTMCKVYTWCVRLITRAWENRLYRLPPKTTTYILHVVSITTHTRRLVGT